MNNNSEKGALPVPVMEFDPVPFDQATGMFTDEEKYKYIRCLVHYWYHCHTQGIPDDNEGLRELCHCDLGKWARLKGMIFDNDKFFYLEAGKWHQKRARKAYQTKQSALIKKLAQTDAARNAKLATHTLSQSVTDSVNGNPTTAQIILMETALQRLEKRLDWIRGQQPLQPGDRLITEREDLKTERRKILNKLGMKV